MNEETSVEWEVINPSDYITFEATETEARIIGWILRGSCLFVTSVNGEKDPVPDGYDRERFDAERNEIWSDPSRRWSYAMCFQSFLCGGGTFREVLKKACESDAVDDSMAYWREISDRKRTSMNDICAHFWKIGDEIMDGLNNVDNAE